MRIGLLTEGGAPCATGDTGAWWQRLVRGLAPHDFDLYAVGGPLPALPLPPNTRLVPAVGEGAPAAAPPERAGRRAYGRRDRRRFAEGFRSLAAGLTAETTPGTGEDEPARAFADGLGALADLARDSGGLPGALRSDEAVRLLEAACRAPGARRAAAAAGLRDHLAFADHLERVLRPLSLDWYDETALGAADLCHATAGGPVALPGLLAKRFFGTPLLVTEYGVGLRSHYLDAGTADRSTPLRTLLAALHGRLAGETYREAALLTPGNAHARRWQERLGAARDRVRTVHPGMPAERFAEVGEDEESGEPGTLVWIGRVEPAKDLVSLLHAFAELRARRPGTRLRIVSVPAEQGEADHCGYLAQCAALAAQLFPDEAAGAHAVGENPVSFEELGGPEAPTLEDVYASAAVVILSSTVEGFPASLVEAMFCARATVSTDVGAVVEIIGGTGLVVPPRNPRALADACLALLRDPGRRHRLGAAARARALELFTVDQNLAAFRGIYLELLSHAPARHRAGSDVPFAHPAEAHLPGSWAPKAVPAGTGAPDA
ncbi:glycosyltransferase [Streptomyces roseolus]|uniref:glycosyltransferase n=1 Tax=Streptomyces roseolus TaxID=67358 RepID=UPI001679377E|nr:glycosyltransferase [Streptomyces roseolus]GGR29179.1 transferase [Streptomyces roseolus]